MSQFIDMTGQRVGILTVIRKAPRPTEKYLAVCWLCACDCGKTVVAAGGELRFSNRKSGYVRSCGCLKRNKYMIDKRHYTPEYKMWLNAKRRAKIKKLAFDVSVEDVQIPKVCPLLGTELQWNPRKWGPNTPTLDRKKPELGYVKGNIWVISFRANLLKNNATSQELERLVHGLRNYGIV